MIQGEQVQDSELSTQAVIYLGPSSMSLMVAEAVRDRIRLLDFLQQPVPMARDIFRFHRISRHTMDRCVQIIGDYLEILKEYGAGSKLSVRFMISNIISEADNVDVFVNRMHVAHGLRGRRIDDGKMTRLIYVKVQEALAQYPGFSKKKVLVVHTGPGNTRVLLFQKGRIVRYSCYRLGTHRTGEAVGEIEYGDDVAELSILREHMRGQVDQICLDYGGVKGLAGLIVIGQEMQQLRDRLAPTPEGKVACSSLAAEAERMSRTTLEQRMNVYGADFAGVDSLLPAVLMTEMIARSLNLDDVIIPASGYDEEFSSSLIRAEQHPGIWRRRFSISPGFWRTGTRRTKGTASMWRACAWRCLTSFRTCTAFPSMTGCCWKWPPSCMRLALSSTSRTTSSIPSISFSTVKFSAFPGMMWKRSPCWPATTGMRFPPIPIPCTGSWS